MSTMPPYNPPTQQMAPPPLAAPPPPKKKSNAGVIVFLLILVVCIVGPVMAFTVVNFVKPELTNPVMAAVKKAMGKEDATVAKADPKDFEEETPEPGSIDEIPAPADPAVDPSMEESKEPATEEPAVEPEPEPEPEEPAVEPEPEPVKPPEAEKPKDPVKPKDPNTPPAETKPNMGGPRKWYVHVGNCLEAKEARDLQADLNGRWASFGMKQDSEKGRNFTFWKVGPREGKDPKSFDPADFCYQIRTGSITAGEAKVLEGKLIALGHAAGTGSLK